MLEKLIFTGYSVKIIFVQERSSKENGPHFQWTWMNPVVLERSTQVLLNQKLACVTMIVFGVCYQ